MLFNARACVSARLIIPVFAIVLETVRASVVARFTTALELIAIEIARAVAYTRAMLALLATLCEIARANVLERLTALEWLIVALADCSHGEYLHLGGCMHQQPS